MGTLGKEIRPICTTQPFRLDFNERDTKGRNSTYNTAAFSSAARKKALQFFPPFPL